MNALRVVRRVYHRAAGNMWWGFHRVVEAPLYLVPRTETGERVYDVLWSVCGRWGQWCVFRARHHYRCSDR